MKKNTIVVLGLIFSLVAMCILPARAMAKTEIVWWHAMAGFLGKE